MAGQRRLAEAVDLGLGPVHARAARWRGPPDHPRGAGRRPGPGGVSRVTHAEIVERVRDRLARDGRPLSPAHVARALRDEGRPVGDATVLAVVDELQPRRARRRAAGAAAAPRRGDRRARQRPGAGVRGPRRRARADLGPVPRRRRRAPAGATAGLLRRATARRRDALRRPPAARRHPVPRRPRPGLPAGHAALAPRATPAGLRPRRAGRHRHGLRGGGRPAPPDRGPPAGVPGHRRHRVGEDHPPRRPAVPGRPDAPAGAGGGRQRAASRAPARGGARGPAGERRGGGCGALQVLVRQALRMRPTGSWWGGPRRRGGRPARGDEHRPRGWLRHPARQLERRRARPHRGAGDGRRTSRAAAHSQLASALDVVVHVGALVGAPTGGGGGRARRRSEAGYVDVVPGGDLRRGRRSDPHARRPPSSSRRGWAGDDRARRPGRGPRGLASAGVPSPREGAAPAARRQVDHRQAARCWWPWGRPPCCCSRPGAPCWRWG